MKKFFHKLLNEAPARANTTHAVLLVIIGAYFIYMGSRMIANTRSGASSMPMSQSVALCVIMAVIGLLVIGYGGLIFYHANRQKKDSDAGPEDEGKN